MIPMWSASRVRDVPGLRVTKDRVRNCGMVRSGVLLPRIWARMSFMIWGITSRISFAHSSLLVAVVVVILVALSNS